MPLTLVLGPANSAKAGEVLGAYATAARRNAILVVPTVRDAGVYARELASAGAIIGGRVETFRGLAREIAARAGYLGTPLSALQRARLVRRAVAAPRLRALSDSASAPGFAVAAGNLIAELERSLVAPARFARALDAWAAADSRRVDYAHDLSAVYRSYAAELERFGRVDQDLYSWRALDALRAAPGRWGSTAVFFYGFDDLTPLERDAIETLCRVAGAEVTVSLTYEPGRVALSGRASAVEELRPLADGVVELPALDEHYGPDSRTVLHRLERRLFEPGDGELIDPGAAVALLESGGERAEAELVAAEVLALLRAGVAAEEIVIVYRVPARVAPLLIEVFAAAGLPLEAERTVRFQHTALGRGVLALARCALLEPAPAGELLTYLRTPGVLRALEVADALEAAVRRQGLRTAAQARSRLGWELREIDDVGGAADPLAVLARHARRLFGEAARGRAPLLDGPQADDAGALAILQRAHEELSELGDRPSGAELLTLLEHLELDPAPVRRGAVTLASPLSIRARRFRVVFVCGLVEGEFPAPSAPDPFLSDERRRELAVASGLLLRRTEDDLGQERYLFYACVSRASERVVLSYRSSDEEGKVAVPSPFIADVAELLDAGWIERRHRRLLADVVWPADAAPTAREQARAEAAAEGRRRSGGGAGSLPAPALSPTALEHVRHREVVSAGALELYAACPVKWLVERELQPDRFEPEPDPLARGNLMHDLLERLLAQLGGPITPDSLPRAEQLLDELLAEAAPGVARARPDVVRAAARQSIAADLRRYLRHDAANGSEWEPQRLELQFGFEDAAYPGLELEGGVRVRGVIDRVDVEPGGRRAIVRDYKSGSARPAHQGARWGVDRQLQVALYMLTVRRLLDLDPVAGLYQPLGGDDLRPRGIYLEGAPVGDRVFATDSRAPEEFEAELEDACRRAVELAARLRCGELTPCPHTCSRDGCAYPGICGSTA